MPSPPPAFGPLSALFRDSDEPRASASEIDWYRRSIPVDAGLVLDAMCGFGRLLVPLAELGIKVHGVDASAAMLARCAEKTTAAALTAPLFRQDVGQLNVPFRYGCAIIAGSAFQYITDAAEVAAALDRLRVHLVAPGLLIIDGSIPYPSVQRLGAPLVEVRTVKVGDGTQIALRSERTWNAEARLARVENRYAHRRGAQRLAEEHERLDATWYPPDEIVDIVRAAGFHDVTTASGASATSDAEGFALTARL